MKRIGLAEGGGLGLDGGCGEVSCTCEVRLTSVLQLTLHDATHLTWRQSSIVPSSSKNASSSARVTDHDPVLASFDYGLLLSNGCGCRELLY
ncbi:MAG: hypothetical protein GXP42_09430 [Chloroflexi bacterium]|nr:hypothetical protein [Chloroflexota bacterium]